MDKHTYTITESFMTQKAKFKKHNLVMNDSTGRGPTGEITLTESSVQISHTDISFLSSTHGNTTQY